MTHKNKSMRSVSEVIQAMLVACGKSDCRWLDMAEITALVGLIREWTPVSFPEIKAVIGYSAHSSVILRHQAWKRWPAADRQDWRDRVSPLLTDRAPTEPIEPTFYSIARAVARMYGVDYYTLVCGNTRSKMISEARQIVSWLVRRFTPMSLYEVRDAFGYIDHTTILHGIRTIERRRYQRAIKSKLAAFAHLSAI